MRLGKSGATQAKDTSRLSSLQSTTKYHSQKVELDGEKFDSKHEANRWVELRYMERAGLIKDLKRQQKYCLIPTIEGPDRKVEQRATYYIADFTYYEKTAEGWHPVVEDAKGMKTDVYKLKKKLMFERYGIKIREV